MNIQISPYNDIQNHCNTCQNHGFITRNVANFIGCKICINNIISQWYEWGIV